MTERNSKSKRWMKTKLGLAIGFLAIGIAVFGAWGPYSNAAENRIAQETESPIDAPLVVHDDTELPKILPVDRPRTGVPMLVAYPLARMSDQHIEIAEDAYPWIGRVIKYGETPISEMEMKEYYDLFSTAESHFFVVKSADGSASWYSIEYYEPILNMDTHNVKAYTLNEPPDKFVPVNLKDQPWLQELVEDSHSWYEVDIVSANALRQLSDTAETLNFEVIFDDGHAEYYNIRYAGPELGLLSQE